MYLLFICIIIWVLAKDMVGISVVGLQGDSTIFGALAQLNGHIIFVHAIDIALIRHLAHQSGLTVYTRRVFLRGDGEGIVGKAAACGLSDPIDSGQVLLVLERELRFRRFVRAVDCAT